MNNSPLQLQPGEYFIWEDMKKRGIIHRRVVQILAVTNRNIIIWKENNPPPTIVPIASISDVVIMDRRNSASSNHLTYAYGSRQFRNYNTIGNYSSKQIGTIVFFVNGQPRITFYGVDDPQGLKNLVMTEVMAKK